MFDRIAGVYDLLNTAMTAGLHHRWRARAADLARVGPGSRVLDVATGTGDLAIELARRVSPGGEVVGSDFAEGMLARARAKAAAGGGARGATALRVGGRPGAALSRAARSTRRRWALARATSPTSAAVLRRWCASCVRAGAWWCSRSRPRRDAPLSLFYGLWFDRVVPVARQARRRGRGGCPARGEAPRSDGTIADAYTYLPNSVKRFPPPALLAAEMERAGLGEIGYVLTAGGIVAIHAGTVPPESA